MPRFEHTFGSPPADSYTPARRRSSKSGFVAHRTVSAATLTEDADGISGPWACVFNLVNNIVRACGRVGGGMGWACAGCGTQKPSGGACCALGRCTGHARWGDAARPRSRRKLVPVVVSPVREPVPRPAPPTGRLPRARTRGWRAQVGAGLLSMAWCLKEATAVPGVAALAMMCIFNIYSFVLLAKCCECVPSPLHTHTRTARLPRHCSAAARSTGAEA